MDIDQFKKEWNSLNQNLVQDIVLNREAGRLSLRLKSGNAIDRFVLNGVLEMFASVALLVIATFLMMKQAADWRFLASGIVFNGFMTVNFVINYRAVSKIDKIDMLTQTVLETSRSIAQFKKMVFMYLRYLSYMLPLMILSIIPLAAMGTHSINVFENPSFFILRFGEALILAYVAVFLFNRYFFKRRIQQIENNIEYLKRFEARES